MLFLFFYKKKKTFILIGSPWICLSLPFFLVFSKGNPKKLKFFLQSKNKSKPKKAGKHGKHFFESSSSFFLILRKKKGGKGYVMEDVLVGAYWRNSRLKKLFVCHDTRDFIFEKKDSVTGSFIHSSFYQSYFLFKSAGSGISFF